jgi:hypothetical protein
MAMYYYVRMSGFVKALIIVMMIVLMYLVLKLGSDIYFSLASENAFLTAIQRLVGGVLRFTTDSEGFANSRYDLTQNWFDFVLNNPTILFVGLGFGVSNAYTESFNSGMTFDVSLPAMLLNSFGIVGVIFVFLCIGFTIYKQRLNSEFVWIFCSIFVASLINPSGIFWQMLVFLFALTVIASGPGRSQQERLVQTAGPVSRRVKPLA